VDLHTHTVYSDGHLTPEALVEYAVKKGLAAVAITDHDSIEAFDRAHVAAARRIEMVPGVEISSALEGLDLHILGYFVDPEHEPLHRRLLAFQTERRRRAGQILDRLASLGVRLDVEEIFAAAGPGVVGRPHVAAALVRAGAAVNLDDAFRRYLGANGAAFVPRPAFHPQEAIALVHAANGVSVLAHPGSQLADAVIERLVSVGLRGIEVWHPQHTPSTVRRYRTLAERLDLVETGGSDFHGFTQGTDLGDLDVPYVALLRLKQAAGVAG
jgi:predicted metal-dependent phosphoesterase TrpH